MIASMGAHRVSRRPPPQKKFWGHIGGLYATFSSYGGLLLRFSHFGGPFHHVGAFLLLFTSWWGPFSGLPPPLRKFPRRPWLKESSRACSPVIFLCDRNLLSSGHVLLRFCLRNDKKMINVPARWVQGMLIRGKCW